MIEITILNYLNDKLNVPAYMEIPKSAPESYVLIEKIGSSKENYIYHAMMAIQSIAPTLLGAAELNESVKSLMDGSVILDEICRAELNSDYNHTDTSTKNYRYQAVYDIVHY